MSMIRCPKCDGYCLAVDVENAVCIDAAQEIPQLEGTREQLDGLSVKGVDMNAPWGDYKNNKIKCGDRIKHPSGECGLVIFLCVFLNPCDQWRVDYGDGIYSRLCLQIGEKGRAIVVRGKT